MRELTVTTNDSPAGSLVFTGERYDFTYYPGAEDVVTTTAYLPKDVPALKLSNGKLWWQPKTLRRFGKLTCKLSDAQIDTIVGECEAAVAETVVMIDDYEAQHPDFKSFGERLKVCWKQKLE